MFEWSWYRLTIPGVIAGIVIMALGMIFLTVSKKLGFFIASKSKKDKQPDYPVILKLIAGVVVLGGALLTVFSC